MRVALGQMRCEPGNVAGNTRIILDRTYAAADQGAAVVVFPEMSDTGYHMPTILRTASSWEQEPFLQIAAAAARLKIAVVVGLSERVGKDIFNTTAVIGSDGTLVAKYRKTHLITAEPVREHEYLRAGDSLTLCSLGEFRVGLMTCYDIRFPELARKLALSGAELLIVPAAFPVARIMHWEALCLARAIENQAFVIAVNRVGVDEGLVFGGSSCILDPSGAVIARAQDDEALVVGDLSRSKLDETRATLKVFADRRADLY